MQITELTIELWPAFKEYVAKQKSETDFFRPRLTKTDEFQVLEGEYHYVLLKGEIIVGYFFLTSDTWADIGYAVLAPYQGQGWGSRIVEFLLNKARELNLNNIEAIIDTTNYKSILLLYKHGFRVFGERLDGEINCVVMRKTIL